MDRADDVIDRFAKAAEGGDDGEQKQSQASAIVEYVEAHAILFHDQNKEVFAQDRQTQEVRRIDSRAFKDWLAAGFYKSQGKALRDQSLREALGTLNGIGRFRSEQCDVFLRFAQDGKCYLIDIGMPGTSRAIKVQPGRWSVVDRPGVRFFRTEAMQPIPEPVTGGSLAPLWKIANVPHDCRLMVLTWLLECVRTDTPYPVLELLGEQGSAKSTTQAALKRLIDPNACDLRGAPKCAEDAFVSAGVNAIVS